VVRAVGWDYGVQRLFIRMMVLRYAQDMKNGGPEIAGIFL
jgi:hypothetical protein